MGESNVLCRGRLKDIRRSQENQLVDTDTSIFKTNVFSEDTQGGESTIQSLFT